ncbi:unnamed protein product, partial [Sphacelaria rigidula]
ASQSGLYHYRSQALPTTMLPCRRVLCTATSSTKKLGVLRVERTTVRRGHPSSSAPLQSWLSPSSSNYSTAFRTRAIRTTPAARSKQARPVSSPVASSIRTASTTPTARAGNTSAAATASEGLSAALESGGTSAAAAAAAGGKQGVGSKPVAAWLFGTAGAVAVMVTVGGITRMTKSGLSMTDWKVQGSLPPTTEGEWRAEFERYKTYPEWQQRQNMTLEEF